MKNRITTALRRPAAITVAVCMALTAMAACSSGHSKTAHRRLSDAYESEVEDLPATVLYDSVFTESGQTDVCAILKKAGIDDRIRRFLCIYNDRVYFTYMTATDQNSDEAGSLRVWNIASAALDGGELTVHHTALLNPVLEYGIEAGTYEERSSFFKNGVIVLNDGNTVIEYNIKTDNAVEFEHADYVFPSDSINCDIIDFHTIQFTAKSGKETVHQSLTFEKLTEASGVVGEICNTKSQYIWDGESCYKYFFSSVQCINEKTYIICEVMNYLGEIYAIVLEYDFKHNSCLYVDSYFIGDRPYGAFYLIDTYQ